MDWPEVCERATFFGFGSVLTEEQIVPGTSPSALDLEVFNSFLRRLGLDLEEDPRLDRLDDLRNRGVVALDDALPRLTLYGLLCFGGEGYRSSPERCGSGTVRNLEMISSAEGRFVRPMLRLDSKAR